MTPTPPPSAPTDEQIIERLAVEVMGWEPNRIDGRWEEKGELYFTGNGQLDRSASQFPNEYWNPLTDWNHWRQVEEKVMENYLLFSKFTASIAWMPPHEPEIEPTEHLVYSPAQMVQKADLPTRCKSLILALDSLKND